MRVSNITAGCASCIKSINNKKSTNTRNIYHNSQSNSSAKNVSFYGIWGINKSPLDSTSERLNAAIQNLDNKSIVLFAEDLDTAKQLLNLHLKNISFPMDNIYFVKNIHDKTSFAVFKDIKNDYKIFKLHPLSTVQLLSGGTNEWDVNVKREYINTSEEPAELKDRQNIKFGPYKKEFIIKTDFHKSNLKSIFDNEVEKYKYFDNADNIKRFNAARIMELNGRRSQKPEKKITFKDIGGQNENIKILEESVIFPIKYPDFYKGFRVNKGILLYGPPRCGKTMLALALANELGINFIKLGANDLTNAHVGQTEQNWRELFKTAAENQPTIIFIDEFDAISQERGGSSDAARYKDDVVNQLLTLMSDLEKSDDTVFVIAATNRKDLIDKALVNSGRFGLQIDVKEPDLAGTLQIYEIYENGKPIDKNINKDTLCKIMFDNHFNGSDIAETFYTAHSFALKRLGIHEKMRNGTVTKDDLENFEINQNDMEKAINKLTKQKNNS